MGHTAKKEGKTHSDAAASSTLDIRYEPVIKSSFPFANTFYAFHAVLFFEGCLSHVSFREQKGFCMIFESPTGPAGQWASLVATCVQNNEAKEANIKQIDFPRVRVRKKSFCMRIG
jgi:hypothetical protein